MHNPPRLARRVAAFIHQGRPNRRLPACLSATLVVIAACGPIHIFQPTSAGAATTYGPYSVVGTGANGLNERSAASISSSLVGNLPNGTALNIACQVSGGSYATGGSPSADSIWDQLASGVYVADYWVSTPAVGTFSPNIPQCGATTPPPPPPPVTSYGPYSVVGTGANGLNEHSAPSISSSLVGHVPNGTALNLACQVAGGSYATGGSPSADSIWDQLASGVYVADYWVSTPAVGTFSPNIPQCGAAQPPPVSATSVVNHAHGLCLDAAGQTDANNGGRVQLWSCWNGPNQRWVRVGNEIINQAHGLCLDAAAQTNANNGGTVQLWSCLNNVNQQWQPVGSELVNQAHGLCLDAAALTDASNGGKVQLWSCLNNANQQWTQGDELVNQAHGLCLDAAAQTNASNGGKVQLWSCLNNTNQEWVRVGNELVNRAHGLCLDAAAQTDASNGGTVQLWSCTNTANQQWLPVEGKFVNLADGLCLDASAQTAASNGGTVQLWSCWKGSNQQWVGRASQPLSSATATSSPYPYWYTATTVCNHVFRIDSPTLAWDPTARLEVSRSITFGYWNGHCVYKNSDTVGVDVNTKEVIQLNPYHQIGWHWDVLIAAGAGYTACNPPELSWAGVAWTVRGPVDAWCAAAGAIGYVAS